MMMESIFSFLSSYFCFIILAIGKSSKFISFFLASSYWVKMVFTNQTDCKIFKSYIFLESDEKAYFFANLYQHCK